MPLATQHFDPGSLSDQLRNARGVTQSLIQAVIDRGCRRFPSLGQSERTARLTHLIEAKAWTDVVLALVELELPLWQVRRMTYDEGEWHCALSRERELPDWLDNSVEARHADLAAALLFAFVEAQILTEQASRPSVPSVGQAPDRLYEPMACDNLS